MHRLIIRVVFMIVIVSLFSACVVPPPDSPPARVLAETANQSKTITQSQSSPTHLFTPEEQLLASLPGRGVAPELFNETWLNSPPLKLADLRGKVVLIKFWTFG